MTLSIYSALHPAIFAVQRIDAGSGMQDVSEDATSVLQIVIITTRIILSY